MSEPITREEAYLAALGGDDVTLPAPVTRTEMYLAYLNGMTVNIPAPVTRKDYFLYILCRQGIGGGCATICNQDKTITENGEYTADEGYTGLGTVTVNVEATGDGDELWAYLNDTLEEVAFNDLESVRYYTFLDKTALRKVNLPKCTQIGAQAFKKCTGLEEVYLDKFTGGKHGSAGEIFANCDSLHTVYVPEIDTIPPSFLRYCGRLKNFIFGSKLGWVTDYCLSETAIEQFIAPSVVYLTNGVFYGCRSLERVDVTMSQTNCNLGNVVFQNCEKLTSLIIRATNRTVPLSNVSAFDGTPFASGGTGGTVYVPSALISEYQQATNWSTLYAAGSLTFAAIEGSEYE